VKWKIDMTKTPWAGCLLAICMLAFNPVSAAEPAKHSVTFMPDSAVRKHNSDINRIEHYLSTMTTIVSNFTQVAPDGSLTSGKFFLKRPGKMRWQYNPPTPILMVSNGSSLTYYDYELEQVSHVSLDSTLIGFLAQEQIRFDKNIGITEFTQTPGAVRVTLAQRDKPSEGEIMLEFSDKPLTLRSMVIRDATNQITSVSLTDAQYGVKLDSDLFVFHDPRTPRNRK
jgi:outer membrane lipoprotein-sorting protein